MVRMRIKSHPGGDGFSYQTERTALYLGFEASDHVKKTLVEATVGGDSFLDGDVCDVRALENGDAAPLAFMHHVDGMQPITLAEKTIVCRGYAAALGVSQIHAAGLKAGFFFNELGESFADSGELRMTEGIDLAGAEDL